MSWLSLVLELHHPLPAPGQDASAEWVAAGMEIYWPILRALDGFAAVAKDASVTLAVSPSWTALATSPACVDLQQAELSKQRSPGESDDELSAWIRSVRGDALGLIRGWGEAGAVEAIPMTATHTWLPSVASDPVVARAQVGLAVDDHRRRFEARASGIWLPFLSYLPGLEAIMAEQGLRYFGVASEDFIRGTVAPPLGPLGPLVTPIGVASFGVSPPAHAQAFDPHVGYGLDPRYGDPELAEAAAEDHACHFFDKWAEQALAAPIDSDPPGSAISTLAISAQDLAAAWPRGGADLWLRNLLDRLADAVEVRATSFERYLGRYPSAPMGRPGVAVGGPLSARPADSDLFDRCQSAADILGFALDRRKAMNPDERETVAEMIRCLLRAQQVDWAYRPDAAIDAEEGLRRSSAHLSRFYRLAAGLMAGHPSGHPQGGSPEFLPNLDIGIAAGG